jgi:hypothetical protein
MLSARQSPRGAGKILEANETYFGNQDVADKETVTTIIRETPLARAARRSTKASRGRS